METSNLPKVYIHSPSSQLVPTLAHKIRRYLLGSALTPLYWLLAHRYATPGLQFHLRSALLGVQLLFSRQRSLPFGWSFNFMFLPMDSTRYFEFDFAWQMLSRIPISAYLDVSSPRLLPILFARTKPNLAIEMINPDVKDLELTAQIVEAAGLSDRCHLHNLTIEDASFAAASFDTITCISVLEHIPADSAALEMMWQLLTPGGRLILTVPCAAQASEQYIDHNEYGLLPPDVDGYVFWQRFYDETLLRERIFRVIGLPRTVQVYGEKEPGLFQKNAARKRSEYATTYPFWREPWMMGQEYRFFSKVADLPGEGVIGMEFVKP
jgi:SAM-dependent methyltransferase